MTNHNTSLSFICSFGEVGRTVPDHTKFITTTVVQGLCGMVVGKTESPDETTRQADNFIDSQRLDYVSLRADLHRGLVPHKTLRDAVFAVVDEAEAKHSTNLQMETRFGELMTTSPQLLQGRAKDRGVTRREETFLEFRSRVDLFINQSLSLDDGLAFITKVEEMAVSLGLDAKEHLDLESARQRVTAALELLREDRRDRWFGREARVRQGTEALATALLGWAQVLAQEEARREAVELYARLEELAGEIKTEVEALRQRFMEVQGQAINDLNTPFPFRGEWSDPTEEPLIPRPEVMLLAEKALGYPPDQPGPEQIAGLADHLAALSSRPLSSAEELAEGIMSSFRHLLNDFFPITVENALDILARRDQLSDHQLGQEILDDLLRQLPSSWLQINEAKLSDELANRRPILRLGVPDQNVLDRFFGDISWAGQVLVVPGLTKVLLVRVDGGTNMESIQQWPIFESAMQTASRDGYGPVIPAVLLGDADQRTVHPETEADAVVEGSVDDGGVHHSPIDGNGQNPQSTMVE